MTLLYVLIVFLAFSLIIVIHEFGHFVAGKLFGVRVEVFSIGMGKRLFGVKIGDTDYRVSAFPIGGYVAFAGISDTEGVKATGAPDEFPSKPAWQRIVIALAGPAMNLLSGFVLAVALFGWGVRFTSPVVGGVLPGSPAEEAGLRVGDRIVSIDGSIVNGFSDIRQDVALADEGEPLAFEIVRDGRKLTLDVVPRKGEGEPFPSVGITPPTSSELEKLTPEMEKAGFRPGDRIVAVNGREVDDFTAADVIHEAVSSSPGREVVFTVLRDGKRVEVKVVPEPVYSRRLDAGIMPPIVRVTPGMPAAEAGIEPGDCIVAVNGERIETWGHLIEVLSGTEGEVEVKVVRNGKELAFRMTPREAPGGRKVIGIQRSEEEDYLVTWVKEGSLPWKAGLRPGVRAKHLEMSQDGMVKVVLADGSERSWRARKDESKPPVGWFPVGLTYRYEIVKAASFGEAVSRGFTDCVQIIKKTYLFLAKLVSARISPKLVSGPVGIVHISYRVLELGLTVFLHFLVLISINLAVVNLLPLPILDGGNVVLFLVEWISGKPLDEKTQGLIIKVGLVLILGIFVLVTFNDISRLVFGF